MLLTNMHSEMGSLSQAGFVDPQTGEKVRPTSYAHTVSDVVDEASKHGFEVVGVVQERRVDAENVEKLGRRAVKWMGANIWFAIVFRKRVVVEIDR
jgi:hypothetical protein